jgi:hypothetical protein
VTSQQDFFLQVYCIHFFQCMTLSSDTVTSPSAGAKQDKSCACHIDSTGVLYVLFISRVQSVPLYRRVPAIHYQEITVSRNRSIKKSTAVELILIIVQVIPVHHRVELRRLGHHYRSRGCKVIRVKVRVTWS